MQFEENHEAKNEKPLKNMTITEFNKTHKVVVTTQNTSYLVLDEDEDNIHTHTDDIVAYTEIHVWDQKQISPVYQKVITDKQFESEQDIGHFLIEELGLIRE